MVGGLRRRCSSALTPALSLAGEGAGLPPSPRRCPSRARGPDFRPHPSAVPRGRGGKTTPEPRGGWLPGVCGGGGGGGRLVPPVALPPSPQPSPSRARGPDCRPHPGAVPRGGGVDGGRLRRRLLSRPHPSPLPHGRGGRTSALTPALSLAGEGAGGGWAPGVCGEEFVVGGCAAGSLPPSPQPSPSRARGPDFRPHPSPLPHGRGGRTSALTPALSLAGEGVRLPLPLRSVAFLCYSYVVSHARGHIVLCLRHPYITHGPS